MCKYVTSESQREIITYGWININLIKHSCAYQNKWSSCSYSVDSAVKNLNRLNQSVSNSYFSEVLSLSQDKYVGNNTRIDVLSAELSPRWLCDCFDCTQTPWTFKNITQYSTFQLSLIIVFAVTVAGTVVIITCTLCKQDHKRRGCLRTASSLSDLQFLHRNETMHSFYDNRSLDTVSIINNLFQSNSEYDVSSSGIGSSLQEESIIIRHTPNYSSNEDIVQQTELDTSSVESMDRGSDTIASRNYPFYIEVESHTC